MIRSIYDILRYDQEINYYDDNIDIINETITHNLLDDYPKMNLSIDQIRESIKIDIKKRPLLDHFYLEYEIDKIFIDSFSEAYPELLI